MDRPNSLYLCGELEQPVLCNGICGRHPVHQSNSCGDIVEVQSRIIYTGGSSMHIAVDIKAINPMTRVETKTTHCVIVFAAVDAEGKTVPVPAWVPQTEEEKKLQAYALKLSELRKEINEATSSWF